MQQYFVMVHVKFDTARRLDEKIKTMLHGGQPHAAGYFQNFALNATSLRRAENLIIDEISEHGAKISIESAKEIVISESHPDIVRHFESRDKAGVWYRSGRAYYPAS